EHSTQPSPNRSFHYRGGVKAGYCPRRAKSCENATKPFFFCHFEIQACVHFGLTLMSCAAYVAQASARGPFHRPPDKRAKGRPGCNAPTIFPVPAAARATALLGRPASDNGRMPELDAVAPLELLRVRQHRGTAAASP